MFKPAASIAKDFNQIAMQQAARSLNAPVYCRYCGLNVKEPTSKSPRGNNGAWMNSLDWEIRNEAHVSCAQENMGR
jgi:hypothetical protein